MKDFNFNQKYQDDNLEALLSYRKKKIAKQEIIFIFILTVIITMFVLYAIRKIRYTDFDGYITTQIIDIKANDDLFLTKMYKTPGSLVVPGDTLFSYIYMGHFMENLDKNKRPDVINRERDVRVDYENVKNEIKLLEVQIFEIKKQLSVEDHNIQFGISDNEYKMELQRNLVELEERLKGKRSEILLLGRILKELSRAAEISGYSVEDPMRFNDLMSFHSKRKTSYTIYRLAHDTAFVADVSHYDNSMIFKKDEILKLQPINAEGNKLHIKAYVPIDDVDKLSYNQSVDVIINDEWTFKAHMIIMASRVVDLPDNLKSNFSSNTKVLLADFLPDEMQEIPFWAITDGIPVHIRVRNLKKIFSFKKNNEEHLIYRTRYGLPEESKRKFEQKLLHQ